MATAVESPSFPGELISIHKASKLEIVKKAGITWDILRRLVKDGQIRAVNLSSPDAKRQSYRTTEVWVMESLGKLGYNKS